MQRGIQPKIKSGAVFCNQKIGHYINIYCNFILAVLNINSMETKFKIGDKVSWNSEAGRVSGTIIKVHTKDFDYKGYTHHATEESPQYEIKSDKSDHIAAHKGSALTKI
ncbi:DUF2945 family protein [Chryseobacterium nakagawai]|nr:DUF2945 family protein [Chryseobacterium nakagawai]